MSKVTWLAIVLLLACFTMGFADWKDGILIWSPSIKLGFATTMIGQGIINIATGSNPQEWLAISTLFLAYAIPNGLILSDIMNEKPSNVRFLRQCVFGIDLAFLCVIGLGFPLKYLEPWKSALDAMPGAVEIAIHAGAILLFFGAVLADSIPFSIESGYASHRFAKDKGFFDHLSFAVIDAPLKHAVSRSVKSSPRLGIFFTL
jgi:hypothetical protein